MDTKKLRQKILDLAIRGKLVPQDPNDEPASVLLERIRAEKEQLIKEGKIKRSKKSATTDKSHYENPPFEIPESWEWVTIEDIAESNIGLTYKPTDICADGVPVYRSNNIQNRRVCLKELVRVNTDILEKQYLQEGDLLICARNGSRKLVGKCAIIENLNEPTSFGAFMAVCRSALNPWIFQILNSEYFNTYLDDSNSTAINQVTQKMLLAFQLPIPPAAEQERIISKLKQWYEYIDEIEAGKIEIESCIKQTKSKILDLAISGKLAPQNPDDEPAIELLKRINPNFKPCDKSHYENLPKGWTICKISDLCKIENGFAFSSDDYKTSGIPLIRISNITNNTIDLSDCVYIENIEINDKYIISKGDLLIAMSGATTGKMGVYKNNNISYLNQRVCNVKIIDNSILLHSYRNYLLQSKVSEILKLAYGGAQPNISTTMIGNFEILLPPYNEQERIVSTIESIFTQIDSIIAEL